MFFECNECQVVLHGERAPFVCPNCGLAGVFYSPVDEVTVASNMAEGEYPMELELFPEGARDLHRPERAWR